MGAVALKNYKNSTIIGSGALILWALEPLVISELINIPLFEALTIVFISCFVLTAIKITIFGTWHVILKQKLLIWIVGIISICGSDLCYMLGAKLAPIAHIDLIDYLWPCLITVVISFLPNEKFRTYSICGAILGFIGIFQLCFTGNDHITNIIVINHIYRFIGYAIAILGICLWGGYTLFSKYHKQVPHDMVGIYCGIGAIISFIIHLFCEHTVIPQFNELGMAVMLGLAGPGLAYQLWDHGVKYGNVSILSTGCYFARVFALMLLVYFDKEPFSPQLVVAGILTTFGMFISTLDSFNLTVSNKSKIVKI